MNEIISIIGVWALANLFVSALSLHKIYSWLDIKPFNCSLCLTWWFGLFILITLYGYIGILYSAIATIINYYTYDPRRF